MILSLVISVFFSNKDWSPIRNTEIRHMEPRKDLYVESFDFYFLLMFLFTLSSAPFFSLRGSLVESDNSLWVEVTPGGSLPRHLYAGGQLYYLFYHRTFYPLVFVLAFLFNLLLNSFLVLLKLFKLLQNLETINSFLLFLYYYYYYLF